MKIVLLGAPGSGKGTYANTLKTEFNIPHISTGDIFRKNLKEKTPLGLQVADILARGQLVPDDITIEIVKTRLLEPDTQNGYILDGFPRTVAQAVALEGFSEIDCVLDLEVDSEEIIDRLSGRRFCGNCGGAFNTRYLKEEVCPDCGGGLSVREDDKRETVADRLVVYENQTAPLIEFYKEKGKLKSIDGLGLAEDVYKRILEVLV